MIFNAGEGADPEGNPVHLICVQNIGGGGMMIAPTRIFNIATKICGCLLLLILSFTACSKVNQDNYNRLKVGMTYQEVVGIIGQPDECSSAVALKNCTWGSEKKGINIQFAGEKAVFFSGKGLN
jgi:hypothetical protein